MGSFGCTLGGTIDRCFSIGATGAFIFDSSKDYDVNIVVPPQYKVYVIRKYAGYGGLLMEVTLFPKFPVNLTIPAVIGAGGVAYRMQEDNEIWCNYGETLYNEYFFVASICARLQVNVVNGVRISIGPSYRYVSTVEGLNSISIDMSMKFGKY